MPKLIAELYDHESVACVRLKDKSIVWNMTLAWRRGAFLFPAARAWLALAAEMGGCQAPLEVVLASLNVARMHIRDFAPHSDTVTISLSTRMAGHPFRPRLRGGRRLQPGANRSSGLRTIPVLS